MKAPPKKMNTGGTAFVLMIILLSSHSAGCSCIMVSSEDVSVCVGSFECVGSFDNLQNLIRDWSCRRNRNFHSSLPMARITNNFRIKIKMKNINIFEEDIIQDIMPEIHALLDHVIDISWSDRTLMTIPDFIFLFERLRVLDVSNNNISSIDLVDIQNLNDLQVLNASFNSITELRTFLTNGTSPFSYLSTIDVSHNRIKVIDDNYFSKFSKVLHLNISYNLIESFSILTFEGLSELEIIYASNNKIKEINMSFARFAHLKELSLAHNVLSVIEKNNFKVMSKLVKLNLSYNKIVTIDDLSFQNMVSLENVQIQGNYIRVVTRSMFVSNNALQFLDLSNNEIKKIDSFAFHGKNIKKITIKRNKLSKLDRSIIEGIYAEKLSFSMNNITSLGPELFTKLNKNILYLNFSCNFISNIHLETFKSLKKLSYLDFSKNQLTRLDFRMSDLLNLSVFNAKDNFITKIRKDTFTGLKSLKTIDLSNNAIGDVEPFSFNDLAQLRVLDLSKNPLQSSIIKGTFHGLCSVETFHVRHTSISKLPNETLYGMNKLLFLNISYGNISDIEYNGFINTGSISVLDLSNNNIHNFRVNNTDLKFLAELYLNNNYIECITGKTFEGLDRIEILNLDSNNIKVIDSSALQDLNAIVSLMLSSNVDLVFDSSIFSNSTSSLVSLHNVRKPFSFRNAQNATVSSLDLSSCDITDLNVIQVGNLAKLETLTLSANKIRNIDKHSFQNLSDLISLDLSSNMISSIQPGCFVNTCKIRSLNLYDNNLSLLRFGVFDGLSNLRVLNVSSNILRIFDVNIFHNTHMLRVVSLDDNMIESLDFKEIHRASIPKVTIGGNLIPCVQLVKSKKNNYYGVYVTAEKLNIHDDNVDGVSCKGALEDIANDPNGDAVSAHDVVTPVENLKRPNNKLLVDTLTDLKFAVYFESSCLVLIVVLLLVALLFVYMKLRSNFVRSYSLSSTRQLTCSSVELEL